MEALAEAIRHLANAVLDVDERLVKIEQTLAAEDFRKGFGRDLQ
jgi:hypothetical protein